MGSTARRAAAAAATVVVAGAVNVATGMLTQHWAAGWWAFTGVLLVVGGALQAWLTVGDRPAPGQTVQGTKVGGGVLQVGSGQQSVTDSEVGRDLTQRHDG